MIYHHFSLFSVMHFLFLSFKLSCMMIMIFLITVAACASGDPGRPIFLIIVLQVSGPNSQVVAMVGDSRRCSVLF